MKHSFDDTIAAIISPHGAGAVSSIRISGLTAGRVLQAIFRPTKHDFPLESHRIYHGWLFNKEEKVDEVVAVYMANPNSYTGEDVVEIDCHGGILLTRRVLELVFRQGARLAEPGEFTKRAFLNGKVGLTKAEAIIDLINAKSEGALVGAANQLAGGIEKEIMGCRRQMIELLTGMEAVIDFPEDVKEPSLKELKNEVKSAKARVGALLATADIGRVLREGVRVVIIGQPNVGKSSLLNALLGVDRAIVDNEPGTTRDTIEELVGLNGIPVIFVDTAGIRDGVGGVEGKGMDRARIAVDQADLVLYVIDTSRYDKSSDLGRTWSSAGRSTIKVFNKVDLVRAGVKKFEKEIGSGVVTSALTGLGITELKEKIFQTIAGKKGISWENKSFINLRQKESLLRANESLIRVEKAIYAEMTIEMLAIDIKESIIALGEASGEEVSDEVIDQIFSKFCVGK